MIRTFAAYRRTLSHSLLDFAPSSESEILAGSLCNWINHKRKELIRLSDNRSPNWLLPLVIEKAGFGQLLSWVVWRFQTACAFQYWDRRTSRSTWHSAAESPSSQPPVSRTPVSGWKVALNINFNIHSCMFMLLEFNCANKLNYPFEGDPLGPLGWCDPDDDPQGNPQTVSEVLIICV